MPAVLKKERWIQGPKCQRYNFIESVMNKTLFMLQSEHDQLFFRNNIRKNMCSGSLDSFLAF